MKMTWLDMQVLRGQLESAENVGDIVIILGNLLDNIEVTDEPQDRGE